MNVTKEGHIHGKQQGQKAEWYYSMSICKNKTWSFSKLIVTELYKSISLLNTCTRVSFLVYNDTRGWLKYILHYFETVSFVHPMPHARSAFDGKTRIHELHRWCKATLSVNKCFTKSKTKSTHYGIFCQFAVYLDTCISPAVEVCYLFIYFLGVL
jgi:hypothetical protein